MAGCYDKGWRTRSQFRLSSQRLQHRCTQAVYIPEMIAPEDSAQSGKLSPTRGCRTRTIREYEQTIEELKKENFDLKLRIYLAEEQIKELSRLRPAVDENDVVDVTVEVKGESKMLRTELQKKEQLIQKLTEKSNEYQREVNKLQVTNEKLCEQIAALKQSTSSDKLSQFEDERTQLLNKIDEIENEISTKSEELQEKIEDLKKLSDENDDLKVKLHKGSLCIQGLVYKYNEEKQKMEIISEDLFPVIQKALQAAKADSKRHVIKAVEDFKSHLCQVMSKSAEEVFGNEISLTEKDMKIKCLEQELAKAMKHCKYLEHKEQAKLDSVLQKSDSETQTEELLQRRSQEPYFDKFGHSNNVSHLKEEICMLLLKLEEREVKISELMKLNEELQSNKETSVIRSNEEFNIEIAELHDRLSRTALANNELMKHLKDLQKFMEKVLRQEFDSSSGNISDSSSFLSQMSGLLRQSMNLSQDVLENINACGTSKIFDVENLTLSKMGDDLSSIGKSDLYPDSSYMNDTQPSVRDSEGMSFKSDDTFENSAATGKRYRWWSSVRPESADETLVNSDNIVVLGTSDNEELVLLLGENGTPEKVLLRNSHSSNGSRSFVKQLPVNFDKYQMNWQDKKSAPTVQFDGVNQVERDKTLFNIQHEVWENRHLSSDSDIWSEPDRDISMQRIGIDVKNSPSSVKSPRKSRASRTTTDGNSSGQNSGSFSKNQSWLRRKRSSGKRLADGRLERSTILQEKCSEFVGLLNQCDKEKQINPSKYEDVANVFDALNEAKAYVTEASAELENISDKTRGMPCEKCIAVELASKLNKAVNEVKTEEALQVMRGTSVGRLLSEFVSKVDNLNTSLHTSGLIQSSVAVEKNLELKHQLEQSENYVMKEREVNSLLQLKVNELKDKNSALESSVQLLQEKLQSMEQLTVEERRNLASEMTDLKTTLQDSERVRETLCTENRELKSELLDLRKKNDTLRDLIGKLEHQISDLNSSCDSLREEMSEVMKHNESLSIDCNRYKSELAKVTDLKKGLELRVAESDNLYEQLKSELQQTRMRLEAMNLKCAQYENELSTAARFKNDFLKELENTKHVAMQEKCALLKTNEELARERKEMLQRLSLGTKQFEFDKSELKNKLIEKTNEIQNLYNLANQLENEKRVLQTNYECVQGKLLSSNVAYEELNRNFQHTQETLKSHEMKLDASRSSKNDFLHKLVALMNTCMYNSNKLSSTSSSGSMALEDKFNMGSPHNRVDEEKLIEEVYKSILSENSIMSEKIDELVKKLNELELALQESRATEKKHILQVGSMQDQLKQQENDVQILKAESENLHKKLEIAKDEMLDKEKLMAILTSEKTSLQSELSNLQRKTEDERVLSKLKDDQIIDLKQRLDSASKSEQNFQVCDGPSYSGSKEIAALVAKVKSLEIKMGMYKKRVELLEKEKSEMRNHLLKEVSRRKSSDSFTENMTQENLNLRQQLDNKNSFIEDLRSELHKTTVKAVEVEEEKQILQEKLASYERNAKDAELKLRKSCTFPESLSQSITVDIQNLNNCKWDLMKSILALQETYYQEKQIHKNHIEKFKKRIETLHSLQSPAKLVKHHSDPALHSDSTMKETPMMDMNLKSILIGLEIDVECLQYLKIFLERFLRQISSGSIHPGEKKSLTPQDKKYEQLMAGQSLDLERRKSVEVAINDDKWKELMKTVVHKVRMMETIYKSLIVDVESCQISSHDLYTIDGNHTSESLFSDLTNEIKAVHEKMIKLFDLNSTLISLFSIANEQHTIHDVSDHESVLSEGTVPLSRSESSSPFSCEETVPSKGRAEHVAPADGKQLHHKSLAYRNDRDHLTSSQDSVCQRSHYSSPDLGIESDPNHESSAPEKDELHKKGESDFKDAGKVQKGKLVEKQHHKKAHDQSEGARRRKESGLLCAVGNLEEFELLKQEVQESVTRLKNIISRTDDAINHISKHTSQRKTLEYSTLKEIKDTSNDMDYCLTTALRLIHKFWVASYPSEELLNMLHQENDRLQFKLIEIGSEMSKKNKDLSEAYRKLEHYKHYEGMINRKMCKELAKTRKVMQKTKQLLQNDNCAKVYKYPLQEIAENNPTS